MKKKIIRISSWIVLFLMICRGYVVNAALIDTIIIDTTTITSGQYLNDFINNSIAAGYTKFYISDGEYYLSDIYLLISLMLSFPVNQKKTQNLYKLIRQVKVLE